MKDELSTLLGSWQPEVPDSPAFSRRVWSRIETRREPSFGEWLMSAFALIARPPVGVAVLSMALLGGIWVGALTGPKGHEEYLRSVNPYAQIHPAR